MTHQILTGDALAMLRTLPDASVHCCVTSPPYWSLRDYGHDGQIGLEDTPDAYVTRLVAVFDEVRRVLRDDGQLWLNLGDSFFEKQLQGIPWKVAFALQAAKWWLRSDIVWAKGLSFLPDYAGSAMPESVTDRPTKGHEYLFLLTKSARYFYDNEAVKEPASYDGRNKTAMNGSAKYANCTAPGQTEQTRNAKGAERWPSLTPDGLPGRNLRTVWAINPGNYPDAHFATFPTALVEPCILAGTSAHGVCPACGAPWVRVVERTDQPLSSAKGSRFDRGKTGERDGGDRTQSGDRFVSTTTGWRPSCDCDAGDAIPATVLDPFAGSGTTLAVAVQHKRSAIGIELNPEYVELIHKRLGKVQPRLFNV